MTNVYGMTKEDYVRHVTRHAKAWRQQNNKWAVTSAQAWHLIKRNLGADAYQPWINESQLPKGSRLMPLSAEDQHLAKTEVSKGCGYNVEDLYHMGDYRVKQPWEEFSLEFRSPGLFPLEMCLLQWRLDNETKRPPPLPNRHFVHESKGFYGTTHWVEAHTTKRRKLATEEFSETACADFGACFGCKWQRHPHIHTPICGGDPEFYCPPPSPNSPLWFGCRTPNPSFHHTDVRSVAGEMFYDSNNWWCFGLWWCRSPEIPPSFALRICNMCTTQFRVEVPQGDRWGDHERTWDPYTCNGCWEDLLDLEDEVVGPYMA